MRQLRDLALAAVVWVVLGAAAPVASACLAHYCSAEHNVARSPLIVLAEVVKVEQRPFPPEVSKDFLDPDGPTPSVATLRVTRVLKGEWDPKKELRLHSGPIGSCAPYPVHYGFTAGEARIFLVCQFDPDGTARLTRSGSVHDLTDLQMIESRLDRLRAHREHVLALARRDWPQHAGAGAGLHQKLAGLRNGWPSFVPRAGGSGLFDLSKRPEPTEQEKARERAFDAARAVLGAELKDADARALLVALALDADRPTWSAHSLWGSVQYDLRQTLPADWVRAYWRDLLLRAGVADADARACLDALGPRGLDLRPDFPLDLPFANDPLPGGTFTTDFILRYHAYDRGFMFVNYGMRFDSLANLDPARAGDLVRSLWNSDDPKLHLVAYRTVERVPGTAFAAFVADRMIQGDRPGDWRALVNERAQRKGQPDDGDARLGAMVAAAHSGRYSGWGIATFWRAMRRGECFEPVCIREAIARLAALEKSGPLPGAQAKPDDRRDEDRFRPEMIDALRDYLDAAQAARKPRAASRPTADDYRKGLDVPVTRPSTPAK